MNARLSAAETLDIQIELNKLPTAQREHRFHPQRKWRFDWAWPLVKVAVECEGGVWTQGRHTRGAGYIGDLEKYNAAALLGWTVLRFTPLQIKHGHALAALQRLFAERQAA